ncbi:MAG: hypothetical protein U0802_24430 [Candidatus Binatia bacterium]
MISAPAMPNTALRGESGQRAGRPVGEAGAEQRARSSEGDDRFGVPVGARAAEAEVGERHVHQVRVAFAHRLGGQVSTWRRLAP